MNQSSIIVATLLAGFVLYVAAKGRLGTYLGVLWGNTAQATPSGSPGGSGGSGGIGDLLGSAQSVAETAAVLGAF